MTVAIQETKAVIVEEWLEAIGYDNYMVSNLGRVTHKKDGKTNSDYTNGKIFISQRTDRYGYKQVSLYSNGKQHSKTVHRLVLIAFIENPLNKAECNHKDGNKENNNVINLEWCTHLENMQHAYRTGLMHPEKLNKKVTMKTLDGVFKATFASMTLAETITGTSRQVIGQVISGRYKTAGGYLWELA